MTGLALLNAPIGLPRLIGVALLIGGCAGPVLTRFLDHPDFPLNHPEEPSRVHATRDVPWPLRLSHHARRSARPRGHR
ncbi:MAG TPA: hypothetical protein VGC80_17640, partial [Acetobacteraceae bacterium]